MNEQDTTGMSQQRGPDAGRRNFLKLTGAGFAALGVISATSGAVLAQEAAAWDKTFPQSEKVEHQKVTFTNRYGITLSGDLYLPKDRAAAACRRSPSPARSARSRNSRPASTPRPWPSVASSRSPSIRPSSAKAAASPATSRRPTSTPRISAPPSTILGLHASVDRERIGIIGICGFAGMALNAVAADKRVKAVATTSMYDMSRVMARAITTA